MSTPFEEIADILKAMSDRSDLAAKGATVLRGAVQDLVETFRGVIADMGSMIHAHEALLRAVVSSMEKVSSGSKNAVRFHVRTALHPDLGAHLKMMERVDAFFEALDAGESGPPPSKPPGPKLSIVRD